MKAVGAYLKTLRERNGLSNMDVAVAMRQMAPLDLAKLNVTYIWRIESGTAENPSVKHLGSFARVVGGSMDQIMELLWDSSATEEEGKQIALLTTLGASETKRLAQEYRAELENEPDSYQREQSTHPSQRVSRNGQSHDTKEETEES